MMAEHRTTEDNLVLAVQWSDVLKMLSMEV